MGRGPFRAWSRDGRYVYFLGDSEAVEPGIFRVAISTNKLEKILNLKGFRSAGLWGAYFL